MSRLQEKLNLLFETVNNAGPILILPHNNPDPDSIASAAALHYLLEQKLGIEARIAYGGIIGRAENRALVNYLKRPIRPLTGADLTQTAHIALVDTQPGAGNNPHRPEITTTVVIDHHPHREAAAAAGFADIRPNLGATSTILTEYIQETGLELPPVLATALFYGIKTDTGGLSRSVSPADIAAYAYLQPRIEDKTLAEIERPRVPAAYFKNFTGALATTRLYEQIAISCLGAMDYPDLTAEMADLLSRLEKIVWVICLGTYRDTLYLSTRATGRQKGAGKLAQAIVGQDGTAGGHGSMAGGQVPLKGRNPEQVISQLERRTRQHLNISPDIVGRPLI